MNSIKQCVNSESMWGYCSHAEKKKKKNIYVRKRGMQMVTICTSFGHERLLHIVFLVLAVGGLLRLCFYV